MFKYYDKNKWCNSALSHMVASAMLWLPVTALFIAMAIHTGQASIYLWGFSFSLILALFLFHRAQTSIIFPTVEVCSQHLILNTPVSKRAIYNLEYIEGARFFGYVLYFRHKGWPVFTPLPRMSVDIRWQLLEAIQGG